MRILVLSDSLTLPRDAGKDQMLAYEETWPSLLEHDPANLEVIRVGIGSGTTEDILYQTRYWTGTKVDCVIIQVGLCDALPRALKKWEVELVKVLPPKKIWRKVVFKMSRTLRKYRRIQLVGEKTFAKNVKMICATFDRILWLEIVNSGEDPDHLPRAAANVQSFNKVLRATCPENVVPLDDLPPEGIMSDHYHMNAKGHRFVADKITRILKEGA